MTRWNDARPHPDPLPREREKLFPRAGHFLATGFATASNCEQEMLIDPPSPGGEGWGEGGCCTLQRSSRPFPHVAAATQITTESRQEMLFDR